MVVAHCFPYLTISGVVYREIGSLPVGGLAGDNIGLKAYSQFLIEMGESVPAAVLPYVSVVLRHLDEEVSSTISMLYQCQSIT